MQLAHQAETHQHAVRRIGAGVLGFDAGDFSAPLLVGARCSPQVWALSDPCLPTVAELEALVQAQSPAVVLLGTGTRQRFPPAAVLLPALRRGIGVEVMDTRAAARTYNVLLGEGREVLLAVLADPPVSAHDSRLK